MRSRSIFTCAIPAAMWNPAILIRLVSLKRINRRQKQWEAWPIPGGLKDWLSLKLACWRLFQGSQKALHLLSQRRWNALLDIDWQLNDVSTRSRHRLLCSGGCSSSHPQGVRPGKEAGWILCRTNWKVRWHIKPSRTTGPFPDGTPGCSEALDELRKRTVAFQLENVWPFGANVLGHSTQHEGPKETVAGLMQKWLKAKEFWWIE